MKSVLISIQPKWCKLIASGKKTVEVRKTRPKLETPFKVYIYETKGKKQYFSQPMPIPYNEGKGKVIGEFVCDVVISHCEMANADIAEQQGCIKREKLLEYANGKELYGWHISDLVIYDKPKELSEFRKPCANGLYCESCAMYSKFNDCCGNKALRITRPPQSWCYVEKEGVQE